MENSEHYNIVCLPEIIINCSINFHPLITLLHQWLTKCTNLIIESDSHYHAFTPYTDVRNKDNSTPLHLACSKGFIDIVRYLVEEGKCDVGELFINPKYYNTTCRDFRVK